MAPESSRIQVEIEYPVDFPAWAEISVDGEEFASVGYRSEVTEVVIFDRIDGRPWRLDATDLVEAISKAVKLLARRDEDDGPLDDEPSDDDMVRGSLFGP